MGERSFERYPACFYPPGGGLMVTPVSWVSPEHEKWLPSQYFEVVGRVSFKANYNNKRGVDPFVLAFNSENDIPPSMEWGLPEPNQEASYKSLAKYAKDVPNMTDHQTRAMNLAWEWTERQFGPYMQNSIIIDQQMAIDQMDMSTSTGYPWNRVYPKKSDLFEKFPQINEWLEQDWGELLKPSWTMFATNSLKEEIRAQEKIVDNKIRTFMSLAVQGTVHGTRLFWDMNQKFYDSHLATSSYVGASIFDGNWDQLYRKLNVFKNGFSMDEKEYDSSLRAHLMWACAKFRYNMLAPEFQTQQTLARIKHYYNNLINTFVITPEGIVVRKKGGNPSGSVNTISDNTIILYALLAYAWILEHEVASYVEFESQTSKALNGDDNIWTVSDEALPYFNAKVLIKHWCPIGITTTTDSLSPLPVDKLDFLSARFMDMGGIKVPVYQRERFMTTLLYSAKKKQTPAYTLERLGQILSIGWCDPVLRDYCRELQSYIVKKYQLIYQNDKSWQDARALFFSDDYYWTHFTGVLQPESYSMEELERSEEPLKKNFQNNIEMSTKVNRAQRYLDSLVSKGLITKEGEDFLVEVIDPFNDLDPDAVGYPDGQNIATVPLVIKKTLELRKPSGLLPGNWTAHIFTLPITSPVTFTPGNIYTPLLSPGSLIPSGVNGANLFTFDMFNAFATLDGNNIGIFNCTATNKIGSLGITGAAGSLTQRFRVVSAGWEIYNTTAPLVTQGIVTCWRQPAGAEAETRGFLSGTGGAVFNGSSTCLELAPIPQNPGQALVMEGSCQWAAKDGNYTVIPFGSGDLPTNSSYARKGIHFVDRNVDATPTWWNQDLNQSAAALPALSYGFGINDLTNQQMTGAIYSGLPETATLTLNIRVYVELVVGANLSSEQNFSRIARKSSPFDPTALQLYTGCLRDMPVSVMVRENGFGDWFMGAADRILNFATPILKMIPHPAAQGAATIATAARGVTNGYQQNKRATKEKQTMVKTPTITQSTAPVVRVIRPKAPRVKQKNNPKPIQRFSVQGQPVKYQIVNAKKN